MTTSRKSKRRLQDAYTFPGFRPRATIKGVFGNPKARIVTLVRHSKKHAVAVVAWSALVGTIERYAGFVISLVAIRACTWSLRVAGLTAKIVAK
jgi:hypothetical protein